MGKTIDTLVQDIKEVLENGVLDIDDAKLGELGVSMLGHIRSALLRDEVQSTGLRMSSIGQPCNRKLWYSVNEPDKKEELTAEVRMKFLFGHLIEELVLFLAEVAGHRVEGRQDLMEVEGIPGHRDAVIDGVTVDAKSASTYSFKKFESHLSSDEDSFGYIPQIQGYIEDGQSDPLVTDKERGAFLVIDKTLGNICLDIHPRSKFPIRKLYNYKKDVVARPEPPARSFDPVPEGKSGNMKLPVNCSYCDFKRHCYPGLRTFLYANKPVFLTTVKKVPNVPELEGTSPLGED